MSLLLILPVLIPLATGAVLLLVRGRLRLERALSLVGMLALLGAGIALLRVVLADGIQAVQLGAWDAPFGITFVADTLAAVMVLITGVIGAAVGLYSLATMDEPRERHGYHFLYHILLMGVCGAFLTGDLFNLFVWFEVMLIASFVLLALGGERPQVEGAIKYVTLNLVASGIFLSAVGILYGIAGTLNMADLAVKLEDTDAPGLITTVAMLFLVAFGIKAAVFPLFFWLPASYHTPPVAVSAVFAGLLTKVGVYALIRVFTLIFTQDVAFTHTILLGVAAFTMITGVLGAAAHHEFRRILSFHIVSQIGYMIMGLALFTPLALAGSVFYIVHHIIVKTNLFLVSGVAERIHGSFELKKLGGLYASHPFLAILFIIPAFSLAGIPPLSGFWAKFIVVRAGLEIESFLIVAVALVVGILTLFSMSKIWSEAFWKPAPTPPRANVKIGALLVPIAALAILTVLIGLAGGPLLDISIRAAEELLDPTAYISAVLGGEA